MFNQIQIRIVKRPGNRWNIAARDIAPSFIGVVTYCIVLLPDWTLSMAPLKLDLFLCRRQNFLTIRSWVHFTRSPSSRTSLVFYYHRIWCHKTSRQEVYRIYVEVLLGPNLSRKTSFLSLLTSSIALLWVKALPNTQDSSEKSCCKSRSAVHLTARVANWNLASICAGFSESHFRYETQRAYPGDSMADLIAMSPYWCNSNSWAYRDISFEGICR